MAVLGIKLLPLSQPCLAYHALAFSLLQTALTFCAYRLPLVSKTVDRRIKNTFFMNMIFFLLIYVYFFILIKTKGDCQLIRLRTVTSPFNYCLIMRKSLTSLIRFHSHLFKEV